VPDGPTMAKLRAAVKKSTAVGFKHSGNATSMQVEFECGTEACFEACPGGYTVQCATTVLVCTPDQFRVVLEALGAMLRDAEHDREVELARQQAALDALR
jgi:hypothetical protein